MEHECLICKKHYTQGGTCCANKKNCLLFEKEEKGKMIRGTFCVKIHHNAQTEVIKPSGKILLQDEKGKSFEGLVTRINGIDMSRGLVSVNVRYHETEMPYCERKKKFKVLR